MKNINIIIIVGTLVLGGLFLGSWLFNHVDPWLGIGTAILTVYLLIRYLVKKAEKNA